MSAKFTCNMDKAYDKLSGVQYQKALYYMGEAARKDMNANVHSVSGNLVGSSRVHVEGGKVYVIWETPYARRVNFTAKTSTLHFVGKAVKRGFKKWKRVLAQNITKG